MLSPDDAAAEAVHRVHDPSPRYQMSASGSSFSEKRASNVSPGDNRSCPPTPCGKHGVMGVQCRRFQSRRRVQPDQACQANLEAGFLASFADRGLRRRLAGVDLASRQPPHLEVLTLNEQHPVVANNRDRNAQA
jgi:hypothetical protein